MSNKYTIRAELIDRANSKGLCPVKVIVTIAGKRTYISTGVRIAKSHWKEDHVLSSHKMHQAYNSVIRNKLVEVETKITDRIKENIPLSIDQLKHQKHYKIVDYMELMTQQLTGKYAATTIRRYRVNQKKIKEFSPEITFTQVNHEWLRKYEVFLINTGISGNTVFGYFKVLKKVFNMAARDGVTSNYPFKGYDNPRYTKTNPVYLTEKEIAAFEKALLKPLDTSVLVAGKYFLLGCYSGLRVSDWLRFNKEFIHGERLVLRAKKNGELVSMKMHSRLKALVKELLRLPKPVSEQKLNKYIKVVAGHCKPKITKTIATHTGRHTFAVRCAELGISQESTAELMGITIATCGVYYRITGRKLDSEMEKWDK